jgi:hypothetical protein
MYYKSITRKKRKVKKVVKSRKYSKLRKYSKKRTGTYKYRNKTQNLRKKRISITRKRNGRKMYGGVGECDTDLERASAVERAKVAIASFPKGFKTFFDILETCPDIIQDVDVQMEYTQKIELKDGTRKTGYIGLLGLQLINYLHARITKLRELRDKGDAEVIPKIKSLRTAISLMDQVAAAPGITGNQMLNIKERVDKKYYDCYVKLYNQLATEFELKEISDPLSTSVCYFSQNCDSDGDSDECDDCCIPNNLDFAKRQNTPPDDEKPLKKKR